ncbi:MAG: CvpA family protein [Candidatus Izemoplasmatales bacterium]|nr:CvpA family protein [Candidatus Izemoplasmatales bacterium]
MNILNLFGIVDVLIVLSVIGLTLLGWKSGFLLKVIQLASSLFGLIASILLARPFSKVLDGWFGEGIYSRIETFLLDRIASGDTLATEENIREAFEGMALPNFIVDWVISSVNAEETIQSFINAVTPLLTSLVLLLIAFVTLFFGSMLLFLLLKLLAKMITSLPIIKQIDKFLGAIFGLFKAAVLIFVLLFLLGLLITIPAINNYMGEFIINDMQLQTDSFRLSKWLYDNNVLKYIINVFVAII